MLGKPSPSRDQSPDPLNQLRALIPNITYVAPHGKPFKLRSRFMLG